MASTQDVFWIEMEWIDGSALDTVLEQEGPLLEREVVKVYMALNLLISDILVACL